MHMVLHPVGIIDINYIDRLLIDIGHVVQGMNIDATSREGSEILRVGCVAPLGGSLDIETMQQRIAFGE